MAKKKQPSGHDLIASIEQEQMKAEIPPFQGEGVERVFPLHSPSIQSIKVVRRGRARRAKLHYLRDRRGRSARLREDMRKRPEDKAQDK